MSIRVLIIDDSAFMRRAIRRMLDSDADIEVVGAARHGREGVELARQLRPHVITLDIEMPEMDGLTALRHIMCQCPTRVLMLSSLTTEGSHAALTALQLGACEVLAKSASSAAADGETELRQELLTKVRALGRDAARRDTRRADPPSIEPRGSRPTNEPVFRHGQFDVICIGSSTGGPPALETILAPLPAAAAAPVVVAQHMPELFTRSLAERLARTCAYRVLHAEDGMPLESRTIYIAPGGRHTHIHRLRLAQWKLAVNHEPTDAIYRPGVDALLHSAAHATAARTLAIVLTGIGQDGLAGATALHAAGGVILAQSEASCVVYGMPKAVTQAGLISASLCPKQIARSLRTLAAGRDTTTQAA
jgi:two-component system, chemotaxis family, protein-glutamate methylesterase/glutaminase